MKNLLGVFLFWDILSQIVVTYTLPSPNVIIYFQTKGTSRILTIVFYLGLT